MKIGIDTFACDGGKSGVGVYLTQLLRRMPRSLAGMELFGWEFDKYAYTDVAEDLEFISQSFKTSRTASSLWHIFKYPDFAKSRNYGVTFFPAAHRVLPYHSPCPTVGTVHDMAAYRGPWRSREHLGAVLRLVFPDSLRNLDRIIAVSEWVKQELVEVAQVKASRIEVIPNGIDLSAFYPRPRNEESVILIQPFSFRRPYILYVSRIDYPVKNHIKLIEAFAIFKERTKYPHRLVLAGSDSKHADKVKKAAARSKYKNDIFFTGHFPLKNLPELYAGSEMVVFPSKYEGFGMGVLEAMACGVPVACARSASLPETAEHAALYFDPNSAEDMADRMVTLATNREVYKECRQRGLERAQLFSWERCAEQTFKVIMETAGKTI
ncbi:glycosyltransferase family 4 protein [Gracilinema caldarium]|uniref:Glycosyl transferase group 1 n=1 Tax=Gracilinema caldarium (strain ATCC 51460 / DSM 7334 / H1) TaxID=744872 RepID=F8EZ23_GRAC1|nr:glycosyltransferase family 1 protein [Gracilinema caldarium]AEJ19254.1 glycosyl transferase group 1 [Gracilinema caldarium DSM 7334]